MGLPTLVIVFLFVGAGLGKPDKNCDTPQTITHVRIPKAQVLRRDIFDSDVEGITLRQEYILLPDPAPFTVSSNYNCVITKINPAIYQRVCRGLEPTCVEYTLDLTLESQGQHISFRYMNPGGNEIFEYYWSPCPQKYILRLQCPSDSIEQNNKCAITGAQISIFLVGNVNLSNAPWNDIAHEIFTATGVKFGDINGMAWYYTENAGTSCTI